MPPPYFYTAAAYFKEYLFYGADRFDHPTPEIIFF
jgi:hypothetical protein